jgi:MFS superfamily sulfate permease-like transporter
VKVIGVLPKGLPTPAFPSVELADLGPLFSGAFGIALVGRHHCAVVVPRHLA